MTIFRLSEFLRDKNIPYAGRKKGENVDPLLLRRLRGKRIAIDAPGLAYRSMYIAVKDSAHSYPLKFDGEWSDLPNGVVQEKYREIFRNTVGGIQRAGIVPVFVLEGSPPPMKENTRRNRMEKSHRGTSRTGSMEEYIKYLHTIFFTDPSFRNITSEVLSEMGVEKIRAKYEAEGVCARLVKDGDCKFAFTPDHDIFMYKCPAVIMNLRKEGDEYECTGYALKDICEQLDIDEDTFRLLCILSGTDYHPNIKNMGAKKLYNMIMKNNINTYEEACEYMPSLSDIPYWDIIDTLRWNETY